MLELPNIDHVITYATKLELSDKIFYVTRETNRIMA